MTEATSAGPRGPTRILVAIDGSAPSEVAVGLVAAQPWPPGTAIRVVEAIDLGPGIIGGPWPTFGLAQSDELETSVRAEARLEVEDARATIGGAWLGCHGSRGDRPTGDRHRRGGRGHARRTWWSSARAATARSPRCSSGRCPRR